MAGISGVVTEVAFVVVNGCTLRQGYESTLPRPRPKGLSGRVTRIQAWARQKRLWSLRSSFFGRSHGIEELTTYQLSSQLYFRRLSHLNMCNPFMLSIHKNPFHTSRLSSSHALFLYANQACSVLTFWLPIKLRKIPQIFFCPAGFT